MTRAMMIAAATMMAFGAGAADARPAKAKSKGTSAERAATAQLNQQQLAALNTGTPMTSPGMGSGAMAPASPPTMAPTPDPMTPATTPDPMTPTPPTTPPQL